MRMEPFTTAAKAGRYARWGGLEEPASTAQAGRTSAEPANALDARMLRSLFLLLLGRPPFALERERWLGRGLLAWFDEIAGTREAWQHWYEEQLYYFLLIDNFRPETPAAREIPTALAEGQIDVRVALHRLALSPSFDLRNPGADTFVTVVMEQFLGADVQKSLRELELGKAIYDGKPCSFLGSTGSTQADVVRIAVESREAARHFLAREYRRLLDQDLPAKELTNAARRLHEDPRCYLQLLREWLNSPALHQRLQRQRPISNRLFVRSLFVDLLEREPEEGETEPLRNALDSLADARPLRSVLVRLLLDSGKIAVPTKDSIPDPTIWVGQLFTRLLGREADASELATYVATFHEPECRPETILLALLSSPEYHQY